MNELSFCNPTTSNYAEVVGGAGGPRQQSIVHVTEDNLDQEVEEALLDAGIVLGLEKWKRVEMRASLGAKDLLRATNELNGIVEKCLKGDVGVLLMVADTLVAPTEAKRRVTLWREDNTECKESAYVIVAKLSEAEKRVESAAKALVIIAKESEQHLRIVRAVKSRISVKPTL